LTNTRELSSDQLRVVAWLATPETQRNPKTLNALAAEIGVRPATIQRWRSKKLGPLAAAEARFGLVEHLPEVYETLAKKAQEGSPEHLELFLRVAGEYVPPATSPPLPGETADLTFRTDMTTQMKGNDDA
jgi:DNA-binding MurR/RpiR family transcriptional regulator